MTAGGSSKLVAKGGWAFRVWEVHKYLQGCGEGADVNDFFRMGKYGKDVVWKVDEGSLWEFDIAIENGPFIVDLPTKDGDFP